MSSDELEALIVSDDLVGVAPHVGPIVGAIVVDDYGTDNWPDVGRYTDEVIRNDSRFEFVGSQSRTALFRRN